MNDWVASDWVARLTTPAFTYKPSAVEISAVVKVFLVITQAKQTVLTKDIDDATITEDGFTWVLTQEETQALISGRIITVQVDYLTTGGMRYTTRPKEYTITDSAINEVI